jgi:hypothetical protein
MASPATGPRTFLQQYGTICSLILHAPDGERASLGRMQARQRELRSIIKSLESRNYISKLNTTIDYRRLGSDGFHSSQVR